jgi:hypothetical protein
MIEFTHCFVVPGERSIIDGIHPDTGRSLVYGHTLEAIRERYPEAVIVPFEDWRAEQAARQDTPITWAPTTRAEYWRMLECLPPVVMTGGAFLVGEPYDHSFKTGAPRFSAYRQQGEAYRVASRPLTVAEFRAEVGR